MHTGFCPSKPMPRAGSHIDPNHTGTLYNRGGLVSKKNYECLKKRREGRMAAGWEMNKYT